MNEISRNTVESIEVQVTRTDDPMVFLQARDRQQSPRNIYLQDAVYDAAKECKVIPIKDIKKQRRTIL